MAMEIPSYERDPYQRELSTEIVAVGEEAGRPWAELADTLCYPEGGGQPADTGRLQTGRGEALQVLDVQRVEGVLRHYLEADAETGAATLLLDWERRYDHMQQHTAQHLLTAVAKDQFGWATTSFHLQAQICDIELDTNSLTAEQLSELEERVATEIRAARPISTRRVDPTELADLQVRSRGLPAGHRGSVRLVEIEGLDLNTCGGTHLQRTSEIESLKLLHTESLRGGLRLYWLAGGRVRRALGQHEARTADLRKMLDASDPDLVDVAGLKLEQLKQAGKQLRAMQGRWAAAEGERLAASQGPCQEAHYQDVDLSFLSTVAQGALGCRPERALLLTADGKSGAYFLLVQGDQFQQKTELRQLGQEIAELLAGRGGGSGRRFQGRAGSMDGRERAVQRLLAEA